MADQSESSTALPPLPIVPLAKEPEAFSAEYVKELRRENAHYRTRAKEFEDTSQKAIKDAEELVSKAKVEADARIIRAELKAAAIKAGMLDLDGLKMADLDKVVLTENGELAGVEALMEQLKKDKAYLFGSSTTTHTGKAPDPNPPTPKRALDMSFAEYVAAKAAIITV